MSGLFGSAPHSLAGKFRGRHCYCSVDKEWAAGDVVAETTEAGEIAGVGRGQPTFISGSTAAGSHPESQQEASSRILIWRSLTASTLVVDAGKLAIETYCASR